MPAYTPTPQQIAVLDSSESHLISAGPGTGKTRTAIEKALRSVANPDLREPKHVLFLSFSNAAINRLRDEASVSFTKNTLQRLRFRTYHSLSADFLRSYGRFVGIRGTIRVIDPLEERLLSLEKNWTASNLSDNLRALAIESGKVSFSWLIPYAVSLLRASWTLRKLTSRHYPLIIVDEFQDTSAIQWELLQLIGEDSQVLAFGDANQIIYSSMHGATAERLSQFAGWKGVSEHSFSINHRCPRTAILRFAECLLTGSRYTSSIDVSLKLVPLRGRNQLRSHVAIAWQQVRNALGDNISTGVLVPSNAMASELCADLRSPEATARPRFPVYSQVPHDGTADDSIRLAFLAARDLAVTPTNDNRRRLALALHVMDLTWNSAKKANLQKVNAIDRALQIHLSSASELSAVISDIRECSSFEAVAERFISAILALQDLHKTAERIMSEQAYRVKVKINDGEQLSLFDAYRVERGPLGLEGTPAGTGKTQVMNYHKSKGREFEHVILVVEPRQENSRPGIDEVRRLYYVCATRAKNALTVVYFRNQPGRVLGPALPL